MGSSPRLWPPLILLPSLALLPGRAEQAGKADRHGDPLPVGAVARLGPARLRHGEYVRCALFAPDGKTLVTGGADGVIRCWEVPSGREVRRLQGHTGWVIALALSPDGRMLASGGGPWDCSLRLWDLGSGKKLRLLERKDQGDVAFLAFAPDGKTLYAARDREIGVWEVPAGRRLRTFRPLADHAYAFSGLSLSPDGRTLAVTNCDCDGRKRFAVLDNPRGTLRLLDAHTGRVLRREAWEQKPLGPLAYAPDGRVLAFQDRGEIRLWAADLGKEVGRVPTPETSSNAFAFSPDARTLAVAGYNGSSAPYRIRLWEVSTGKQRRQLPGHMHFINALAFSPDGRYLASGSDSASIRLWDLVAGKAVGPGSGHDGWLCGVAVSQNGRHVATAGNDRAVYLWDAATGRVLRRLPDHEHEVWAVRFAPGGRVLASGSRDGTVRLWDVETGKELHRLGPKRVEVRALAFSPDGKLLASAGGGGDGHVDLWDAEGGREVGRLALGNQRPVFAVAFSPDGKHLAVAEDEIRLWNVARARRVPWFRLPAKGMVGSLTFSPDGRTLLSGGDELQLWEVATGRQRRLWPAPAGAARLAAAALAPDGRRVAATYNAGGVRPTRATQTIHIWDTRTGEEVGRRAGHAGLIHAVAWGPSGLLVTGSDDTTALVWDTAALVAPLRPGAALSATALRSLWDALGEPDAGRAGEAVTALAGAPGQALLLLKEHLRPVPRLDPKHVAALIDCLDDPRFAVRERATAELRALGKLADPSLRRALERKLPLEARRRIERLWEDVEGQRPPMETVRALRCVEVLERVGTAEARELLRALAAGEPAAEVTRQAERAVGRLEQNRGE
jgi:WD40 repeat protein